MLFYLTTSRLQSCSFLSLRTEAREMQQKQTSLGELMKLHIDICFGYFFQTRKAWKNLENSSLSFMRTRMYRDEFSLTYLDALCY